MKDNLEDHRIKELKEMIKEKDPNTPIEKVLAIFCERHALSSETCRHYYDILINEGKIKEK
jgi:hypothetical protein